MAEPPLRNRSAAVARARGCRTSPTPRRRQGGGWRLRGLGRRRRWRRGGRRPSIWDGGDFGVAGSPRFLLFFSPSRAWCVCGSASLLGSSRPRLCLVSGGCAECGSCSLFVSFLSLTRPRRAAAGRSAVPTRRRAPSIGGIHIPTATAPAVALPRKGLAQIHKERRRRVDGRPAATRAVQRRYVRCECASGVAPSPLMQTETPPQMAGQTPSPPPLRSRQPHSGCTKTNGQCRCTPQSNPTRCVEATTAAVSPSPPPTPTPTLVPAATAAATCTASTALTTCNEGGSGGSGGSPSRLRSSLPPSPLPTPPPPPPLPRPFATPPSPPRGRRGSRRPLWSGGRARPTPPRARRRRRRRQ